MKFSRLRLLGFKSFVEPGEFVIETGLTGIVGPNGCGKSNLVEALRWVMGESSYKNMRASGMDDVIFSGTSTRPSRNTAEVTLFLDNQDRSAPAAFNDADELQVSRRIEREAGSVYRINGREARARDVQLLFADQSTGARSPSMVGQGRIGELIQAKPQARRALLEEAAGISGLHSRRHEAELRLRAAEQNLERLDDVVGQLETQIESLKRQARQASRFKTLSAEIRKAEATLLHLRWTLAKAQEAESQTALNAATNQVAERANLQITAAKDQAVGALRLPELREAAAAAAAAFHRLSIARGQLEEEASRIRVRQSELQRRQAQSESDLAREGALLRDYSAMLAGLEREEAALLAESEGESEREALTAATLQAASSRLALSETALSQLTAERAEAAALRSQAERALREAAERRDRAARQVAEVERELSALAAKVADLPQVMAKRGVAAAAEAAALLAEAEAASTEKELAEARKAEAQARAPLQEAKAALARVETEARTLKKILDAGSSAGGFPPVLDAVSVERGYETAFGAALGEDVEAALDRAAPAHWAGAEPRTGDPALPSGLRSLASVVRAPEALQRRLRQIGIVAAGEGASLVSQLAPGQRLVSREGALWRWDGFVAAAHASGAAAQRLSQRNRLAELDEEAVGATRLLRQAELQLANAEAVVRAGVQAEQAARQGARDRQKAVTEARDALARAERAAGELDARRAALEDTRRRIEEAHREAAGSADSAAAQLRAAPDPNRLKLRLDESAAAVARDRTAQAEARAAHDGLRREAEMRSRRLAAIAAERTGWRSRADNAGAQIAALTERRDEAAAELSTLQDAPDEIDVKRRALMSQLSQAETLKKAAADRLQEAENRQAVLDKDAAGAIQSLSQAREARARAEERLNAAAERRAEVEARIQEAIGVPPHLVIRQAGLEPDAALPDLVSVERRLDQLKVERERLGAVNLRAEEEQKELAGQLEKIITEREDIVEAIRKLRQAIQSLNREGRERLVGAFEVVNGHFQALFSHLFGGGTAELQLVESDDPLEAGLEILARPPGKKPQTMTLLSGGEQALTAMALIFAVFLTNPAPICVLDEVDAPLDDHNVERFCNLMDKMAAETDTRFVIITHNPITMARMDRLFGVTMAEQGVSQLVSVDLQVAEAMREAG